MFNLLFNRKQHLLSLRECVPPDARFRDAAVLSLAKGAGPDQIFGLLQKKLKFWQEIAIWVLNKLVKMC